jgi:membrane protease YdiL (CAAX protease family)
VFDQENDSIDRLPDSDPEPEPQEPPAALALVPAWHTILLVAGIVALSVHSASKLSAAHGPINRLATYGFSAMMEILMLAWVAFGLWLKRIPFRSLLGSCSFNLRSIAFDFCVAAAFWIGALMLLGTLSIAWSLVEVAFTHSATPAHIASQEMRTENSTRPGETKPAKKTEVVKPSNQLNSAASALADDPERLEELRALAQLAPANGAEIAAWTLLCLLVGFIEEFIFRGYLQRQFIGWARGSVVAGVCASAVIFGAAHAYQGARGMVLIALFGALFGLLAHYRGSLRAGIIAHGWHDWITGLALTLLKVYRIL